MQTPIVSASWLASNLSSVRVIDFRWYIDDDSRGRVRYAEGHIPGATFIDMNEVCGAEGAGRHPLPSRKQFESAARAAGVCVGDNVVVYDDCGGGVAGRLLMLFRMFGHESVAVLDGGIGAWPGSLEHGSPPVGHGDFVASEPDLSGVLTAEDVLALSTSTTLIDSRAPERFAGLSEPMDSRAGHVPGAVNNFWANNLGADGKFLDPEALRQRFTALGAKAGDTVFYCGSGVTSCNNLIAFELAGLGRAKLYVGSWSDWSGRDDLAIETS